MLLCDLGWVKKPHPKSSYKLILKSLEFSYLCRPDVFMLLTDPNDELALLTLPFL